MNTFATSFLLINTIALLLLPRRWAPLPFLIGTCYMTMGLGIDVGPFTFTVIRILVAVGIVRVLLRGERVVGGMNAIDKLTIVWAIWALISSYFHKDPSSALTYRLGLVYNVCGVYFLLRIFCQSIDDVLGLCRVTAILLVPVALEMIYETQTSSNLFSILGPVGSPEIRQGHIRAQGPFNHSILAGTVAAACLPLIIPLWNLHRREAVIGIGACFIMVFASSSSGPIMSSVAALGALWMWQYRDRMKLVRWLAVLGYICLDIVMKAPAYFLMARIDLAGGSTGWHRARLIQSAFQHLHEWWLGGTDYTRHWMPTGVTWSADHTDITNHYIKMGVIGGLPLMILFIVIIAKGFSFAGQTLLSTTDLEQTFRFIIWGVGSALFVHAVTFISVSYYDQSFVFIYLTLALISSAYSVTYKIQQNKMIDNK